MNTNVHEDVRDVKEAAVLNLDKRLLTILLFDRTTQRSLRWATDDYEKQGNFYSAGDPVGIKKITGRYGNVIRPRVMKHTDEQEHRVQDKAEVFTPSWVCNAQNNLIDNAWFGRAGVFNMETTEGWVLNPEKIEFGEKTWRDYVLANRMEVSCGEGPYITSRYDTVSGSYIELADRIGLLDRKLRVIAENTDNEEDWFEWAMKAVQSIYGYDWQGDNVLLTRENVLYTVIEYHDALYAEPINIEQLLKFARVISWNIWQMDGIKFVVPNSCHEETSQQFDLFDEQVEKMPCPGCKTNDRYRHNGTYCKIMDWKKNKTMRFVDLLKGAL
jgi:hypothetical protein